MAPPADMSHLDSLSARDRGIIIAAFLAHKSPYDLDYDLLATYAGFKNANTARTQIGPVKKKLLAISSGNSPSDSSTSDATECKPKKGRAKPTAPKAKGTKGKKRKLDSGPSSEDEAEFGYGSLLTPKKDDEDGAGKIKYEAED